MSYGCNTNNDSATESFCDMIKEAMMLARRVRNEFNEMILYGIADSGINPIKTMQVLEEINTILIKMKTLQACNKIPVVCEDPFELNNAIIGNQLTMTNLQFIAHSQMVCQDVAGLLDDTNDNFCMYVLGTLSKMMSECYKTIEAMEHAQSYMVTDDVWEWEDDTQSILLCEQLDASICLAESLYKLIKDFYGKFTLNNDDPMSPEIVNLLRAGYAELITQTSFIISQTCGANFKCSPPKIEMYLAEANKYSRTLRNIIDGDDLDYHCDYLFLLAIYYEIAGAIVSLLLGAQEGLGCVEVIRRGN